MVINQGGWIAVAARRTAPLSLYSYIIAFRFKNSPLQHEDTAMALEDILASMESQVEKLRELNHTILFDLGDDGRILLDASGGDVKLVPNPGSDDADTTLTLSAENLAKLMEGDLNPMVAFTMGRLKISGSKGVALKLSSLLDK